MYYDIFGNSEYFRPESKLPINSFQEIFQHLDALKDSTMKKPAYLDSLENKLTFLELTTSDFVRKFNEFVSNQALLTDPAKHTSFLDTIVHFQFAMILVGMEHAELNGKIEAAQKFINKQDALLTTSNQDKVDNFILTGAMSDKPFIEYLFPRLAMDILNQKDLETFEFSTEAAKIVQRDYSKNKTTAKKIMLQKLIILQELKTTHTGEYLALQVAAKTELERSQKQMTGSKVWKMDPTLKEKKRKKAQSIINYSTKKINLIKTFLEKMRTIYLLDIIRTKIPSLIEAFKIFNTFDNVTNNQNLSRLALFGSPKENSVKNDTNHGGYIDFIFLVFNASATEISQAENKAKSYKLNPDNLTTLHQEQIFLTTEIETKLLTLQNPRLERKKFPEACPRILFAYILNLMLFTLLIKDVRRTSSLLRLDTKAWNASLRLICPYLSAYFDDIQPDSKKSEQAKNLKNYFNFYGNDDYFDNGIPPEKIAQSRQSSAVSVAAAPPVPEDSENEDWNDSYDGSSEDDV